MTELTDLSETDASNTAINGANVAEGCPPSGINNAIRNLAGMLARFTGDDSLASAATTDLGSVPGTAVNVTGTTTITALGTIKAGTVKVVRFTGALTLTHNATSLILYSGMNITTYSGLVMTFQSLGSGNWIEVSQTPARGTFSVIPSFGGSSVGVTGNFTGTYYKTGRQATVTVSFSFTDKGSSTGVFRADAFPFLAASTQTAWAGSVSPISNASSLVAGMTCHVLAGQNVIIFDAPITTGTTQVTDVNITNITALSCTITFETSS